MDLYNLLDTVVKIGLGATISGVSTYRLAKLTHDRELRKIGAVRRMESLENVSERAEQYFFRWRQLASTLGGIFKGRNAPNDEFSDAQWKRIKERDGKMLEAKEPLYQVVARLRLLRGDEAADYLIELHKILGEFRDPMILQRITPSADKLKETRVEANKHINMFHKEMQKLYMEM